MIGTFVKSRFTLAAIFILLAAFVAVGLLLAAGGKTVDLVIGDASGPSGGSADLTVIVDTQDQLARGFQINFAYDGVAFPVVVASPVTGALPASWIFTPSQAAPGDFRVIAVNLSLEDVALAGPTFVLTFDIAPGTAPGPYAISTSLVSIFDTETDPFPVSIRDGTINVLDLIPNAVVGLVLPPGIDNVDITPRALVGFPGDEFQLTVTETLSDLSQRDITGDFECTSSDEAVATVTAGLLVTLVSAGDFRIVCSFIS